MLDKAPILKLRLAGSHPTHKIAVFIIVFVWACSTPAFFGQQDVHAALTPPANRAPFPSPPLLSYTFPMSTMVSARLPNDLVAHMDQVGPRSAVIAAALREYLRRKPAPSAKVAGPNKVVQG